jgi:hypothetical protein
MNYYLPGSVDYTLAYLWGKFRSYAQPYISTEFNADQVTDDIYIGDLASSCNKEELQNIGITHVLTAIIGVDPLFPDDFEYKNIYVNDNEWADIQEYFEECVKFIDDAVSSGGKVFVHCMCGVSRSSTLIAAYLIHKYKYNHADAIQIIKDKRDCINPNAGFREQLKEYAGSTASGSSDGIPDVQQSVVGQDEADV